MNAPPADYQLIPIDQLHPHKANVRFALRDVKSMADSITKLGILEPLVVIPDATAQERFTVVLGHRRLAGAKKAGTALVPCLVRSDLAGRADAITAMLVENLERDSLTAFEQAAAYEQLGILGVQDLAIAKMVGRDAKEVTSRRRLMALPEETRTRIADKQLDLDDAAALAKYADDPEALKFLEPHLGTYNFKYKLRDWPGEKKKRAEKAAQKARLKQVRADHRAAVKAAKSAGQAPPPLPAVLEPKATKPSWQAEQEKVMARRARIAEQATVAADVRLAWIAGQMDAVRGSRAKVTLPPFVRGLLNMALEDLRVPDEPLTWLGLTQASLDDVDTLTDLQAITLLAASEIRLADRRDSGWDWERKLADGKVR